MHSIETKPSFVRCQRFWTRFVPMSLAMLFAVLPGLGLALLHYGNPQWHWCIYDFQAPPAGALNCRFISPPDNYTGIWRHWEANGVLTWEMNCVKGLASGETKQWYPSGKKFSDGSYLVTRTASGGRIDERTGRWRYWDENGILRADCIYRGTIPWNGWDYNGIYGKKGMHFIKYNQGVKESEKYVASFWPKIQ